MLATDQMLQLPNALARRGANVFVVDGWGNRGASGRPMSRIYGSIAHWIVSANRPENAHKNMTLGLIVNGHSTLAGPLANLYLRGDGAVGVVAGGRANHGGVGSWRGVSGNQFFVGTEAEGPPFTEAQMQAYPLILAAVYDVTGQHPRDWGISHQEYAPTRKVDIGPAIVQIRNEAVRLVDNRVFAGGTPAPKEDDMYDANARNEVVGALNEAIGLLRAIHPTVAQIQTGVMDPDSGVRSLLLKLLAEQADTANVTAEEIAAALPDGIAEGVADALAKRLAS